MIEPAIVVAALGVISTWIAGRLARRSKKDEAESSPYEALAARVVRLEERNDKLEGRLDTLEVDKRADRGWIARTIARVLEYDGGLVTLLIPWPVWYDHGVGAGAAGPVRTQSAALPVVTGPQSGQPGEDGLAGGLIRP